MLFNSVVFAAFFAIVWLVYLCLNHRAQNWWLLAASYVFYGWWDWRFLTLLWISTVIDYGCARAMVSRPVATRRRLLLVSLSSNLGILGFFKYFNFFADSATELLRTFGMVVDAFTLSVILPVGISFYTFQTMAYTIDVYRGKETATDDFLSFALYVAYFPQLVAGPIERSTHLLPELEKPRTIDQSSIHSALPLILMGYFKKVFIADNVAPVVDSCFTNPTEFGGAALVVGVYLFALQIYGDFSGYTDIARGVSRLFGIELQLNFRQPYLAENITDFWRRWHISLSSWLRDYLYIPLGGNRRGEARTYANNMVTMLLGGLWHGAGWNFVVWGGLHGVYLGAHKFTLRLTGGNAGAPTSRRRSLSGHVASLLKIVATFHLVCLAWVFFRAADLRSALDYLERIVQSTPLWNLSRPLGYLLVFGGLALLLDVVCSRSSAETPFGALRPGFVRGAAYASMLLLLVGVGGGDAKPFIYFQF